MDLEILQRAEQFCNARGFQLQQQLGFGIHGSVWAGVHTETGFVYAVKVFEREAPYHVLNATPTLGSPNRKSISCADVGCHSILSNG